MSLSVKKLLIKKDATITDALRQLGKTGLRCLIVIDKKKKFLGTITDGDVRRNILIDKNFKKKIDKVYNTNSTYLTTSNFNKLIANKGINHKIMDFAWVGNDLNVNSLKKIFLFIKPIIRLNKLTKFLKNKINNKIISKYFN